LGCLLIQKRGNFVRAQERFAALTDQQLPGGIYELAGFYASGAALDTSKAAEALFGRLGSKQTLDIAGYHIAYKLVRFNIHLMIGRAGRRALAALHTL
jgi:hypothetical protein